MDTSNSNEKEQNWDEFQKRQNRRIRIGKIIVIIIAAVNFILSFSAFSQNMLIAIFTVVVQLILSIALIMGVGWVRYLFAIMAGLSAISGLSSLMTPNSTLLNNSTTLVIVLVLLSIVFNIASCILLFFNKCVIEFLYARKNKI